jgi:hypothetical protein
LSIIGAAVLLSPALAFLGAIAVEIVIDVMLEADGSALLALVGACVWGWWLFRKVRAHPYRGAAIET